MFYEVFHGEKTIKQLIHPWQFQRGDTWVNFRCHECIVIEMQYRLYRSEKVPELVKQAARAVDIGTSVIDLTQMKMLELPVVDEHGIVLNESATQTAVNIRKNSKGNFVRARPQPDILSRNRYSLHYQQLCDKPSLPPLEWLTMSWRRLKMETMTKHLAVLKMLATDYQFLPSLQEIFQGLLMAQRENI